jgi:hypothetical protein
MMAALAKAFSQTTDLNIDAEDLPAVLVFCGAGLLLSLALAMTYGLNLSQAIF